VDVGSPVVGCGDERREQPDEDVVLQALVMGGEDGGKDEARALHELFASSCPRDHLGDPKRRAPEQILAALVTDLPAVEALRPAIHLRLGHALRNVDQRCQNPRLTNGVQPQVQGELVVRADPLRHGAQRR
jgi:hypothetical protein